MLNNLFKAYAKAECEEFRDFVKDARRDWERDRRVYDPEILMNECQDEYNRLLLLNRWGARTEQEEQILTLRAEIDHLKSKRIKTAKKEKVAGGKIGDKFSGKWKWKNNPPAEGDPSKKEVEGKTYHWCPGHKFWTMHSPAECTLLHPEKKVTDTPLTKKKVTPAKKLTFAEAAMATGIEDPHEGEEEESEDEV